MVLVVGPGIPEPAVLQAALGDEQGRHAARGVAASSDLAAVDFPTYGGPETPPPPTHAADPIEDGVPVPLYTVANPPGTVSVTSFLDGRISRIELHPRAARMSEAQLAEENVRKVLY